MANQKEKPVCVQFGKELDAQGIVDAIRKDQDDWAKNILKELCWLLALSVQVSVNLGKNFVNQ